MSYFVSYSVNDIMGIHTEILKLSHEEKMDGVLNIGSLEMAVEAPERVVFGREICPDVVSKISTLMYEIITLHPFIEGNKRTGFTVADTLMLHNHRRIVASNEEKIAISLGVAKLQIERDELTEWIRNNSEGMTVTLKQRGNFNRCALNNRYRRERVIIR
jgi:death-on-curing protein